MFDGGRGRDDREEDAAVIAAYMSMARSIESMGLDGVWDLKPMFNGGEIKEILPKIPRGPAFSDVMDVSSLSRLLVTCEVLCNL